MNSGILFQCFSLARAYFTAASGKKPCLAHCRSFRRSLPKRKIFAVWTDLETWPWLSRCASLAMPANDEGKLIAYKWRKSAILETPEQIFLPGRNSRCTFSQTPLTPTWKKLGKLTPPPENFSARGSSSSFSPFTLKCPNSSFLETNFENFLLMHSAQHSLQRVLSSYRQFSFPLPLHIYMAKISDFGNT